MDKNLNTNLLQFMNRIKELTARDHRSVDDWVANMALDLNRALLGAVKLRNSMDPDWLETSLALKYDCDVPMKTPLDAFSDLVASLEHDVQAFRPFFEGKDCADIQELCEAIGYPVSKADWHPVWFATTENLAT